MKPRDGVHRVTVDFGSLSLQCEGLYCKGHEGDMTDPPEADLFEFTYVKHRDEDILELFDEKNAEKLAERCISALKEQA